MEGFSGRPRKLLGVRCIHSLGVVIAMYPNLSNCILYYLFIYLFIFGCVGSSLLHAGFL